MMHDIYYLLTGITLLAVGGEVLIYGAVAVPSVSRYHRW